jgi:hypothetical protein
MTKINKNTIKSNMRKKIIKRQKYRSINKKCHQSKGKKIRKRKRKRRRKNLMLKNSKKKI